MGKSHSLSFAFVLVAAGCGSNVSEKNFGGGDAGMMQGGGGDLAGTGIPQPDLHFDSDAFWAQDPPPKWCGPDGGVPQTPGGTPECPDDKNREGCPCPTEGMKASCWPGLRANRGLGQCHDGVTTCQKFGET